MPDGGPAAEECVFCGIATHRAPAYLIYEDASTAAFLDIFPFTRGHLLVIPKRHGARLTDLPFDDQTALIRTVDEVCRRAERLAPDYNLALNAGTNAGQIVFHVHFHVIPRYGEANPFHGPGRVRLQDDEARQLVHELSRPSGG
jgi:histidine triad (HIT) family protein